MSGCPCVQKLEQLLHIIAPSQPSQGTVCALEDAVYTACKDAIFTESNFGELVRGPDRALGVPAPMPAWTKSQLTERNFPLTVLGTNSMTIDCSLVSCDSWH